LTPLRTRPYVGGQTGQAGPLLRPFRAVFGLSPAGAPALSLVSLSKRFGATQALDDVDFAVQRGEVVALMGANGAGKSTLAKIASGVIRPDGGRILVSGREISLSSPQAARAAGIVVVHQSTDQLGVPGLSVGENLLLDRLCGGGIGALVSRRRLFERARAVADGVGLDAPLDQDFGALGPAHRQLVAIARAVAADALVLILDEPTASLSAVEAERLFSVIDRLRGRGVGVLYISHRLGDIRRIADRIVILRNGRRVAEQAKPFDFAAVVQAMIGHNLGDVGREPPVERTPRVILRLAGVGLIPGAASFDLEIHAGEVVAVTGALGAGKSRLLRALFGLAPIARGSIELDGAPWRPACPAEAIAKGVFMAAEDRWRSSLLPAATPGGDIAGTIALPHRRSWFPWGVVNDRRESDAGDQVIRKLGVRCRSARDTLDLLSGGNQQKVVVGRWQSAPCRLLLLDEPFQGVDIGARRDIVAAVRADRRDGATLIATSDVEEAIEAADVVAVMRGHSIVGVHDLRLSSGSSLIAAIAALETNEADNRHGAAA
jgi:simple sugar transport system ATP-binding protein